MEYGNELLDRWVGHGILMHYVMGPTEELDEDDERFERLFREPGFGVKQVMQARSAVFVLESYDQIGITVRDAGGLSIFVPWGAVIRLQGAS
jgi:hypothetical protein